jgi:hypothetical protein
MSDPSIQWSNSALTTLQQCGEKFRRRYIEKEYTPPSPRMLRGTVVHRVASLGYQRKLADDVLPSVEETRDTAATEFDAKWRSGVMLSKEEAGQGVEAVEAASKDFAVDVATVHVLDVAPAVNPLAVERHITVKPKDSDLVIHGTIDLIDRTATGEVIRDLKTSEKSPSKDAADISQQLSTYAMIRQAEVGTLPEKLTLDTLVRTPVRHEVKHVQQHTTRDPEDMRVMVTRINTAVEAVKRGLFVPADPSSWWCSKSYCDFYGDCVYVRRGDRPNT